MFSSLVRSALAIPRSHMSQNWMRCRSEVNQSMVPTTVAATMSTTMAPLRSLRSELLVGAGRIEGIARRAVRMSRMPRTRPAEEGGEPSACGRSSKGSRLR